VPTKDSKNSSSPAKSSNSKLTVPSIPTNLNTTPFGKSMNKSVQEEMSPIKSPMSAGKTPSLFNLSNKSQQAKLMKDKIEKELKDRH